MRKGELPSDSALCSLPNFKERLHVSALAQDLFMGLLQPDPSLSAQTALQHLWLQGHLVETTLRSCDQAIRHVLKDYASA